MWTYLLIFFSLLTVFIIFFRRAWFLKKQGLKVSKKEEAIENKDNPIKVSKKISSDVQGEVEALCKRAQLLLNRGKEDEAVKSFVQALALDEFHQETQHKLAVLYLKKQLFSAASALFKQLSIATNDPVHYSHLGLALYQQSNFEEALDAYKKAVEIDDSRPQRFVSLAQVYRALGRVNHAVIALNKALVIDNENLDNLFFLANLQLDLNNVEEAKVLLKNLLKSDSNYHEAKDLLRTINNLKKN